METKTQEIVIKGFFKYYNTTTKKIFLEIQDKYAHSLDKLFTQQHALTPYKKYKNCTTAYINVPDDISVNELEGKIIIIRCVVQYYNFKNKEGQFINGYKLLAKKAKEST